MAKYNLSNISEEFKNHVNNILPSSRKHELEKLQVDIIDIIREGYAKTISIAKRNETPKWMTNETLKIAKDGCKAQVKDDRNRNRCISVTGMQSKRELLS